MWRLRGFIHSHNCKTLIEMALPKHSCFSVSRPSPPRTVWKKTSTGILGWLSWILNIQDQRMKEGIWNTNSTLLPLLLSLSIIFEPIDLCILPYPFHIYYLLILNTRMPHVIVQDKQGQPSYIHLSICWSIYRKVSTAVRRANVQPDDEPCAQTRRILLGDVRKKTTMSDRYSWYTTQGKDSWHANLIRFANGWPSPLYTPFDASSCVETLQNPLSNKRHNLWVYYGHTLVCSLLAAHVGHLYGLGTTLCVLKSRHKIIEFVITN